MRESLLNRIREADLRDYLTWRLSTADIARIYNVQAPYVARVLPNRGPRPPKPDKRALRAARWEYRDGIGLQVHLGKLTILDAAKQANCSQRTMFRHLQRARKKLARRQQAQPGQDSL